MRISEPQGPQSNTEPVSWTPIFAGSIFAQDDGSAATNLTRRSLKFRITDATVVHAKTPPLTMVVSPTSGRQPVRLSTKNCTYDSACTGEPIAARIFHCRSVHRQYPKPNQKPKTTQEAKVRPAQARCKRRVRRHIQPVQLKRMSPVWKTIRSRSASRSRALVSAPTATVDN